jgi:4-diphosphocytidyl-2-C-methyl-D-erythritol kinase
VAEGIGDRLTALEGVPPLWLVLVNPRVHVSTAWVYQNLGLTSEKVAINIPLFYGTVADVCGILANDLEQVTCSRFPVIDEIKDELLAAGAAGALMSGSGPTVFGLFATEGQARVAAAGLAARHGWFTAAVQTI